MRRRYRYSITEHYSTGTVFIFILELIVFVTAISFGIYHSYQKAYDRTYIVSTVTDKGIKRSGDSDRYLIYTKQEDGETQVLEVTDSLLARRFNSSDVYADIEIGKTYKFEVGGKRVQLLSWYPNIYGYEEIDTKDEGSE